MEKSNGSIVVAEKGVFTVELIYPSGTGYFTALKSMPSQIALLSYNVEVMSSRAGGPLKHVFIFIALEKCKDVSIVFKQIATFGVEGDGDEVTFKLNILDKEENSFEENFINYNANSATYKKHDLDSVFAAIPYGYPSLKYGYPNCGC